MHISEETCILQNSQADLDKEQSKLQRTRQKINLCKMKLINLSILTYEYDYILCDKKLLCAERILQQLVI